MPLRYYAPRSLARRGRLERPQADSQPVARGCCPPPARSARRASPYVLDKAHGSSVCFPIFSFRLFFWREAKKEKAYAILLRQGYGGQKRFGKRRVAPAGNWSAVDLRSLEPPAPRQRARHVIPKPTFGRSSPPNEAGATFRSGTLPLRTASCFLRASGRSPRASRAGWRACRARCLCTAALPAPSTADCRRVPAMPRS